MQFSVLIVQCSVVWLAVSLVLTDWRGVCELTLSCLVRAAQSVQTVWRRQIQVIYILDDDERCKSELDDDECDMNDDECELLVNVLVKIAILFKLLKTYRE